MIARPSDDPNAPLLMGVTTSFSVIGMLDGRMYTRIHTSLNLLWNDHIISAAVASLTVSYNFLDVIKTDLCILSQILVPCRA